MHTYNPRERDFVLMLRENILKKIIINAAGKFTN